MHPGPETSYLRRGGYERFELGDSPATLQLEHDLRFDLGFLRHREALKKRLAAFSPDLVHITGPGHCGLLGAILAHEMGIPLVASWHTNVHEYAAQRLGRQLRLLPAAVRRIVTVRTESVSLTCAARLYRLARLLFAPNPELQGLLRDRTGRPVSLMARGVDCDLFRPDRRVPGPAPFTIGYVGRVSTEKNVELLIQLDAELRRAGKVDYKFRVIGNGSQLESLRSALPGADFPGTLTGEDLAAAYATFDVFVFPSETDTYGNVVQEALASGVPCVVSARGGPQYLVSHGETGFVAPVLAGFTRSILSLKSDSQLLVHMKHAARAAALTRKWTDVFDEVYASYAHHFRLGTFGSPGLGNRRRSFHPNPGRA